jgi:hypothetical protein
VATLHSTLGASKAERWMNCPGSVRLEAGLPDQTSEYAKEGTAAHSLAERALGKELDCNVWLETEIEGVLVTEEMCDAVQVFVDHVRGRRFVLQAGATLPTMYIEHRFDLTPLNPPGPMFGTSDVTLWEPATKTLEILDYKHGRGVAVDATENPQLLYYALGAVVELKVRPERIAVTIVQPRGSHPAGIIRRYELGFDELVAFKKELFERAVATTAPDAPLKAGGHCKFCKALATCPAQKEQAVAVAQAEFDSPFAAPPAPELLTLDELDVVLRHADQLEDWLGAVRQHVIRQLDAGIEVPGWKLVPKRAMRRWADEEQATRMLESMLLDDAYTKKLLTVAQAEKALKTYGTKLPERLVTKESSGFNLAPASDPRTAALPSAQTDFDVPVEAPVETPAKKRSRGNARKTKDAS